MLTGNIKGDTNKRKNPIKRVILGIIALCIAAAIAVPCIINSIDAEGFEGRNIAECVEITQIAVGDSDGNAKSEYSVSETMTLSFSWKAVKVFDDFKKGDYFDIKLPMKFLYPNGEYKISAGGTFIGEEVTIYHTGSDTYARVEVTKDATVRALAEKTVGNLTLQGLYLDQERVEPGENTIWVGVRGGDSKSTKFNVVNFTKRTDPGARTDINITNVEVLNTTGNNVVESDKSIYELDITWNWRPTDGRLLPGDTFTIELPKEFYYMTHDGRNFIMKSGGKVVGAVVIDGSAKTAKVTIDENLTKYDLVTLTTATLKLSGLSSDVSSEVTKKVTAKITGGAEKQSNATYTFKANTTSTGTGGEYRWSTVYPFHQVSSYLTSGTIVNTTSTAAAAPHTYIIVKGAANESNHFKAKSTAVWNKTIDGLDAYYDDIKNDAKYYDRLWNASGDFDYIVAYCGQAHQVWTSAGGIGFNKVALENFSSTSRYQTETQKNKIKFIIANSYPFITMDEMRNRFGFSNDIDEREVISSVQTAIWMAEAKTYWDSDYIKGFNYAAQNVIGGKAYGMCPGNTGDGTNLYSSAPYYGRHYRYRADNTYGGEYDGPIYKLAQDLFNGQYVSTYQTGTATNKVEIEEFKVVTDGDKATATIGLNRKLTDSEEAKLTFSTSKGASKEITVSKDATTFTIELNDVDMENVKYFADLTVTGTSDIEVYLYTNQNSQDFISGEFDTTSYNSHKEIEGEKTTKVVVKKKWDGYVPSTDDKVIVKLQSDYESNGVFKDVEGFTNIELNEKNKWSRTVTGLPYYAADGIREVRYQFVEISYRKDGNDYTINKGTKDPSGGVTITYSGGDPIADAGVQGGKIITDDSVLEGRVASATGLSGEMMLEDATQDPDINKSFNTTDKNMVDSSGSHQYVIKNSQGKALTLKGDGTLSWEDKVTGPVDGSADAFRRQLWTTTITGTGTYKKYELTNVYDSTKGIAYDSSDKIIASNSATKIQFTTYYKNKLAHQKSGDAIPYYLKGLAFTKSDNSYEVTFGELAQNFTTGSYGGSTQEETTTSTESGGNTGGSQASSIGLTTQNKIYPSNNGEQFRISNPDLGALTYVYTGNKAEIRWMPVLDVNSDDTDDVRRQFWTVEFTGQKTSGGKPIYNLRNVFNPKVYLKMSDAEYWIVGSESDEDKLGFVYDTSSEANNKLEVFVTWPNPVDGTPRPKNARDECYYWAYGSFTAKSFFAGGQNVSFQNRDFLTIEAGQQNMSYYISYDKANMKFNVGYTPATGLTLIPREKNIDLNEDAVTFALTATVTPANAGGVSYVSSDPSVASVNSKGEVTAKKEGKATITAIAKNNVDLTSTCEVIVTNSAKDNTDVPGGANPGYEDDSQNADYEITITNKVENIDIVGKKIWQDSDDRAKARPKSIELSILSNAENENEFKVVRTITLTPTNPSENTWEFEVKNLPKYVTDADGTRRQIKYKVEETGDVLSNYEFTIAYRDEATDEIKADVVNTIKSTVVLPSTGGFGPAIFRVYGKWMLVAGGALAGGLIINGIIRRKKGA